MRAEKTEVLKRLNYIEGHLKGIRKMVDEDRYCVDIVRQTYAVRMAIAKLEAIILEHHLQTCVPEVVTSGQAEEVVEALIQLYHLSEMDEDASLAPEERAREKGPYRGK